MSTTTAPPTTTAEPSQEAPARRRSRLRLVIVAIVVLVGAGVGGYLFLTGGEAASAEVEAPPAEGAVVEVGTLTTNLAGSPGRYARVGLALVLAEGTDPATVEERFALVKDAAISELGQHDAATLQGPEGSQELRDGLARRLGQVYPDGEVLRVVLTELLVQ